LGENPLTSLLYLDAVGSLNGWHLKAVLVKIMHSKKLAIKRNGFTSDVHK